MDACIFMFLLFFFHLVFLNFASQLMGIRIKGYGLDKRSNLVLVKTCIILQQMIIFFSKIIFL